MLLLEQDRFGTGQLPRAETGQACYRGLKKDRHVTAGAGSIRDRPVTSRRNGTGLLLRRGKRTGAFRGQMLDGYLVNFWKYSQAAMVFASSISLFASI